MILSTHKLKYPLVKGKEKNVFFSTDLNKTAIYKHWNANENGKTSVVMH